MIITPDMLRWASFGMSSSWLSRKTGHPIRQIRSAFEKGTLPRPFGTKVKYYCDYDFFETIDTEAKAYWLGFIYADGCVTDRGGVNILLAGYEKAHLEKYRQALNAEHPVEERYDTIRDKGRPVRTQHNVKVRLHSKLMVSHLARLGVAPRKSLTLTFPTSDQVPDHLVHHFVRGYFDGDGSINHSSKDIYGGIWQFAVISSDAFVNRLKEVLTKHVEITSWRIYSHPESEGMAYFSVRNVPDINRIRDYLYRDATIFLDRKRDRFSEMPERYYHSIRHEIVKTLSDRVKTERIVQFTTLDICRLYDSSLGNVSPIMRRLETKGIVKIVGNQGRTLIYELA